jgi:hypothetical protein
MNLRQKAKKLKRENENYKKLYNPKTKINKYPIDERFYSYETIKIATFMPFAEIPIEEYKHQTALEIGKYLVDKNFIEWEIAGEDNSYIKKIIGTIKVMRANNG